MKHGVRFLPKPFKSADLLNELEALLTMEDAKTSDRNKSEKREKSLPGRFSEKSASGVNRESAEIVIVDDDRFQAHLLKDLLVEKGFRADMFLSAEHTLHNLSGKKYRLAVVDYKMPGKNGLELIGKLRESFPEIKTIVLTGVSYDHEIKHQAQEMKVDYFMKKPVDVSLLNSIINEVFDTKGMIRQGYGAGAYGSIIGNSPAMRKLFELIPKVAKSDANLMILGETGTGKELVARAIHKESNRSNKEFVTVNCAALPDNLLESELFGFEKGAFSGAGERKKGLFEWADKGTFFLDEIGDLNFDLQAKLLRVIQEGKIRRIGGTKEIDVDVRIISATTKNIEKMTLENNFREDLFYRLNAMKVEVPRLCEREGDIPLLLEDLKQEYNSKEKKKKINHISEEVIQLLSDYPWPGNVREFRNTLNEMFILSKDENIITDDVPAKIRFYNGKAPVNSNVEQDFNQFLESSKKEYVKNLLKKYNGNVPLCAQHARINRTSFYHILKKYDLTAKKVNDG
jgi:DNA-binding NtrC family response regulator